MVVRTPNVSLTTADPLSRGKYAAAPKVVRTNEVKFFASSERTAIIVIDPRSLIRDCLVRCLKDIDAGCAVLAFPSVKEWLEAAAQYVPMLILFCLQSQSVDDAEVRQELARLSDNTARAPVVIISDSEETDRVVSLLRSGARGYIPTSVTLNVALKAMRLVEAGGVFAPASSLIPTNESTSGPVAPCGEYRKALFTARQLAVLVALRRGKANKQIAYELNMREGTVKVHVRHIMKKLNARNRTEVAIIANNLFSSQENVA